MKLYTKPTGLSSDPLQVFAGIVGKHQRCFLFETLGNADGPQDEARSYIGIDPEHYFAAKDGRFYVDGKAEASTNPYKSLRSRISLSQGLPAHYVGGLVGYLSHEAIRYSEPELDFPYEGNFFDFEFGQYNDGLIFHGARVPEYFHYGQNRLKLYEAIT